METIKKEKVRGVVKGRTLVRKVQYKKHFFWKYAGYSFGRAFLDKVRNDIDTIQIQEEDTGRVFQVTLTKFDQYSKEVSCGYDQVVLALEYFDQVK